MHCDLLLVSGGWNPAVHLASQAGGTLRYDEALGAFLPAALPPATSVAGTANGTLDLAGCLAEGARAAGRGARGRSRPAPPHRARTRAEPAAGALAGARR